MPFPDHIDRLFDSFGVPGDTKQAVYDLYVSMGEEALEVFRVRSPRGVESGGGAAAGGCAGDPRNGSRFVYLQRNHVSMDERPSHCQLLASARVGRGGRRASPSPSAL